MATNGEPTTNRRLLEWVEEWAAILAPDAVHWCDGSSTEYDAMAAKLKATIAGQSRARELMIEGLGAIAEGEHPSSIHNRLQGFRVQR